MWGHQELTLCEIYQEGSTDLTDWSFISSWIAYLVKAPSVLLTQE